MKVTTMLFISRVPHRVTPFMTRYQQTYLSPRALHSASDNVGGEIHKENEPLMSTFNEQVTRELTASQLYLSASLWCRQQDLVGMAAYMRSESDEERGHALTLIDFANKRNMAVVLEELGAPPKQWSSVLPLWESLLAAELENTRALNHLADLADDAHDHALSALLDPFHMEQVESEDALRTMVAKITDEGQTPGLLRQLDGDLAPDSVK